MSTCDMESPLGLIALADEDAPKPLYLIPAVETWVGLDGPALRVSSVEQAERFFPLRRIGRIHTSTRVEWEMAALLACAGNGIPVVFVDEDGRIQARLLGRPGVRDELRSRLIELLLQPEAEGMLRHWMDTHRHRAARWAGRKLRFQSQQTDAAVMRRHIDQLTKRYAGERHAQRTRQWLRGLAYSWMEAHLTDLGLGRSSEIGQAGHPPLAADLTDIFYWYLEPTRVGWLRGRALAAERHEQDLRPPTMRDVTRLFQSRALRAAERGRAITSALHRWLIHET
jgi:hypothetical protein